MTPRRDGVSLLLAALLLAACASELGAACERQAHERDEAAARGAMCARCLTWGEQRMWSAWVYTCPGNYTSQHCRHESDLPRVAP